MEKNVRQALLHDFEQWFRQMTERSVGIPGQDARHTYCFKLVTRFLFLYFLQQQGMLEGNSRYLFDKLEACQAMSIPYHRFLVWLLKAIDTPSQEREEREILGNVPYLRLFADDPLIEADAIALPDQPFQEMLMSLQWHPCDLEEHGEDKRDVLTPAFLGYLVERIIALKSPQERKQTGSFYTPEYICEYITKSTCYPAIVQQFEHLTGRELRKDRSGQDEAILDHLIETLDAREAALLLFVILPCLSILDPAVGAANFLVSALRDVVGVYEKILERVERCSHLQHPGLLRMLHMGDEAPGGRIYFLKKRVLVGNLFGVDIQQEPLDVSRMRLSLALLNRFPANTPVEPLPSLVFHLPRGNSLVGVARITEQERRRLTRYPRYDTCLTERKRLIDLYTHANVSTLGRAHVYAQIQAVREEAYGYLNEILLEQIAQSSGGRTTYDWTLQGLQRLQPFHWAFDFTDIMHGPWWARCDPQEVQVIERDGQVRGVQFGAGVTGEGR